MTWYHWHRGRRGFVTAESEIYPVGAPKGFFHRTKRAALKCSIFKAGTAIDDLEQKIVEARIALHALPPDDEEGT